MTEHETRYVVGAYMALQETPATNNVLAAIGMLDAVLPLPGTPERRAAFNDQS